MTDGPESTSSSKNNNNKRKRRHWYALLCIAAGAGEYALVLTAAGAALSVLFRRVCDTTTIAALTHIAAALWMCWRYDRPSSSRARPTTTATARTLAAAGTAAIVALDAAATAVLRALGHADTAAPAAPGLARVLVAGVAGPLCEEYVFRRALPAEARAAAVPVLRHGVLAGAAFGLLHVPAAVAAGEGATGAAAHVLYAACFGAAAAALDHAAGDRLWPGALAHVANNVLALRRPVAPAHAAVAAATLGQCAVLAVLALRVAQRAP